MKFSKAYATVLRLYPAEHRRLLGVEMYCVFEEAAQERRKRGRATFARFLFKEATGLLKGAGAAWVAQWNGRYAVDYAIEAIPEMTLPEAGNEPSLPIELLEAQQRADLLVARIVHAIAHHDFPNARLYSEKECEAREHLQRLREQYRLCN